MDGRQVPAARSEAAAHLLDERVDHVALLQIVLRARAPVSRASEAPRAADGRAARPTTRG